jgi:phosphotransferase system  glucose/maltose/N-acetylglucosamine-specific IIC component
VLSRYYLVASAIVATAHADAIDGKHCGLAAIFSVAGIGLPAIAFAVTLEEKRSAEKAEPALISILVHGPVARMPGRRQTPERHQQ